MCVSVREREREELFNTNCLVWLCKQKALSLSRLDTHTHRAQKAKRGNKSGGSRRKVDRERKREKLCVCLREVGVLT